MTPDSKDGANDNTVECPTCGKKVVIDEQKAQRDGFVLCPNGHKVELMQGLM